VLGAAADLLRSHVDNPAPRVETQIREHRGEEGSPLALRLDEYPRRGRPGDGEGQRRHTGAAAEIGRRVRRLAAGGDEQGGMVEVTGDRTGPEEAASLTLDQDRLEVGPPIVERVG
jgi:hypothetical protein